MTIYSINFGIGWANSGVEYAQLYRAQSLRECNQKIKFIFLDLIKNENIQTLTSNLGFKDEEIISLYQFFTDIPIKESNISEKQVLNEIEKQFYKNETGEKFKRYFFDDKSGYITCHFKDDDSDIVNMVEIVSHGKLLRRDYYSHVKFFSEFYAPEGNNAKLYLRTFFNMDGSIAYNEYIDGNRHMFVIKEQILYSIQEFIAYFIKKLNLTSKDLILLDRSKQVAQTIVQNRYPAKLGVVIHAEHYNKSMTNSEYILWNNHYEYVFTNYKEIDFFITATNIQKDVLVSQFHRYHKNTPVVYTIPVGHLSSIFKEEEKISWSIITASRLAIEKHIDWLIKAVIQAKEVLPQLKFDIYGEGPQRQYLQNIIDDNFVQSDIQLKGHVDLKKIYNDYDLFISGSTSEGFGLTLMEAVGSSLGIVGFDVNYGNPTFIKNRENGFLLKISLINESEKDYINKLANAIIEFFNSDISKMKNESYKIAGEFTKEVVVSKWKKMLEEVLYD